MEIGFVAAFLVLSLAVIAEAGAKFKLHSTVFEDGKSIPTKYAYTYIPGGKNISVPLSWSGAPAETKSFALAIVDLHPIANNWVHWFVINIPTRLPDGQENVTSLPESASTKNMPSGSKELYNSFSELGYGGPGPPKGSGAHKYEITLYALKVDKIELSENASLTAFKKAVEGKVVATAKIIGVYER